MSNRTKFKKTKRTHENIEQYETGLEVKVTPILVETTHTGIIIKKNEDGN